VLPLAHIFGSDELSALSRRCQPHSHRVSRAQSADADALESGGAETQAGENGALDVTLPGRVVVRLPVLRRADQPRARSVFRSACRNAVVRRRRHRRTRQGVA